MHYVFTKAINYVVMCTGAVFVSLVRFFISSIEYIVCDVFMSQI